MVAPLLIDSSSGCACTSSRRRAGSSVMDPTLRGGTDSTTQPGGQNLRLPIIPAMFVVSSLIVGAMVEEAR